MERIYKRCEGSVSPREQCVRPSGHPDRCNASWCKADDHTVPTDGEPIDRITHALVCAYGTEHPTVALCKTLATGIDDRRELIERLEKRKRTTVQDQARQIEHLQKLLDTQTANQKRWAEAEAKILSERELFRKQRDGAADALDKQTRIAEANFKANQENLKGYVAEASKVARLGRRVAALKDVVASLMGWLLVEQTDSESA